MMPPGGDADEVGRMRRSARPSATSERLEVAVHGQAFGTVMNGGPFHSKHAVKKMKESEGHLAKIRRLADIRMRLTELSCGKIFSPAHL